MFSSTGAYELTVVVPTRNERDNVGPLLKRIERVRPELRMEVLFVDDSTDDTPCVISEQAARSSREVLLIHRREDERHQRPDQVHAPASCRSLPTLHHESASSRSILDTHPQ